MRNYKIKFRKDSDTRVPMQYLSVNEDRTRTPINLAGKRLLTKFRFRNAASDALILDSAQLPNEFNSRLIISDAANGKWEIIVPAAQIAEFPVGFGEWAMFLIEPDGGQNILIEGGFDVG